MESKKTNSTRCPPNFRSVNSCKICKYKKTNLLVLSRCIKYNIDLFGYSLPICDNFAERIKGLKFNKKQIKQIAESTEQNFPPNFSKALTCAECKSIRFKRNYKTGYLRCAKYGIDFSLPYAKTICDSFVHK